MRSAVSLIVSGAASWVVLGRTGASVFVERAASSVIRAQVPLLFAAAATPQASGVCSARAAAPTTAPNNTS